MQHKILVRLTKIVALPTTPCKYSIQPSLNQLDDSITLAILLHFDSFRSCKLPRAAQIASHKLTSLLFGFKASFQLRIFYRVQDLSKKRPRLMSHLKQVVSRQQTRRPNLLRWRLRQDASDEPIRL